MDLQTKRKVAVKRVRKAKAKMSREYQILNELKGCERCIELLDTFYSVGNDAKLTQNFVMELFPDSLEAFIQRTRASGQKVPISQIKKIMVQVLEGLQFIHSKQICHRDLKPDNILLDENYNIKLCDFGSSKKIGKESSKHFPRVVSRYYRAPELSLCHTDYSTKIDIWAAGCIFVELFTLEPLFPGNSEGLQLLETMAVLGPPKKVDQKYLYSALSKDTREMLEKVKGFQRINLEEAFPKGFKKADVRHAASLARKMLQWNPEKRATAEQALAHTFFKE